MYSIYADGVCIYNDRYPTPEYKLDSPVLKMADSAAGSLDAVLPPVNVGYDTLKRMKTTLTVKRHDKEIWEGRIIEDSYDFLKNRHIYCEGALAYFNDTCQPQREYRNVTLEQFIKSVIDIHNSKVPDNRKIYFEYQAVEGGVIEYRATQFEQTLEALNQVCTDYNCHMKIEKKTIDGVYGNYIKFFTGVISSSTQSVEFGKNLLDYTSNFDMSELATVIVPLGAVKTRANTTQIGDAIDLDKAVEYSDDQGWGVWQTKTLGTYINTEESIQQGGDIINREHEGEPGWEGYSTAVLKIKASTNDVKNTVYISSRMHQGWGMYTWQTMDPMLQYRNGKYSSVPLGFTDMVEEAVEVPVGQPGDYYVLTVGSFGGDIQLRVNVSAQVTDQLDEYYTAEDAMVSTVNLTDGVPGEGQVPGFVYGKIYVKNEDVPGSDVPGNPDKTFLRTNASDGFIQNGSALDGFFQPGQYSISIGTTEDKVLQARVFWYRGTTRVFDGNTDWLTLPARFTLPETVSAGDPLFSLRLMLKYANSTAEFPDPTVVDPETGLKYVTKLVVTKGEKHGSLYVTAQSKNLFNSSMEQGSLFESGDLIGKPNQVTDMSKIRTSDFIYTLDDNSKPIGFEPGDYLIHGRTTKESADDTRVINVKAFFYDEDGTYADSTDWIKMTDNSGAKIIIPDRGEYEEGDDAGKKIRSKVKFMFYSAHDDIPDEVTAISAVSELMFEQGASIPSMYEPANSALQEYGWIEKVITFNECENPDELYYKAKTYLASGQFDKMTLSVKALDLSILGVDTDALDVNSYIYVSSRPHGLARFFEISSLDIPLNKPENMQFELGSHTVQTLTSINNNTNSELLAKINAGSSQSYILSEARKNAEAIIVDGFGTGAVITVTNDADQPTGVGFFKVWHEPDEDHDEGYYTEYTGGYPSARWSEIKSDPAFANVCCLLINHEGIVFYGNGLSADSTIDLVNPTGQIIANSILAGTMYADHILGGTLTLGVGGSPDDDIPDGQLIIKSPTRLPWGSDSDHGNMVEMIKDKGILQQGFVPSSAGGDNITRQVQLYNGRLYGSVWARNQQDVSVSEYHLAGEIFMGTLWGDDNDPRNDRYGMDIVSTNGPLMITTGELRVRTSNAAGDAGRQGATDSITLVDTNGTPLTLEFVNGIYVGAHY